MNAEIQNMIGVLIHVAKSDEFLDHEEKKVLKNHYLDYHQKIHLQAYAIFILWTKMIMFKYTESSINVYQTEANKFHLDNLLKYKKKYNNLKNNSYKYKRKYPHHGTGKWVLF